MPVWGWVLLIAGLSLLLILGLAATVRKPHTLPAEEPLHTDVENIAAPLPLDVAAAQDAMTARELEVERERERDPSVSPRA